MATKSKSKPKKKMPNKKSKGSIVGKIIVVINIIFAIALLLSYLSMWINPTVMPYLSFIGYGYPVLLAINICFVILWVVTLRWRFLYSLIVILLGYNVFMSHFESFNNENISDDKISIMDFNTGHNIDKNNPQKAEHIKADMDSLRKLINLTEYDIVCLQEVKLPRQTIEKITNNRKLNLATSSFIPNQINKGASFITITKFPIISTTELVHNNISFASISNIVINADTVRIYNTHLFSNMLSDNDIKEVNNVTYSGGRAVRLFKRINKKITQGYEMRAIQANMIRDDIDKCRYKTIICGDLNDTPCTYTYRIISKDLNDAFTKKGSGWGNTYNGNLPNIRIDYILVDNYFKIDSYRVLKNITISDHFPIACTISKNKEKDKQ